MNNNLVVIVINKGLVSEVYSNNANEKVIIVDLDNKTIGEDPVTEFIFPETKFNEDRVKQLFAGGDDE